MSNGMEVTTAGGSRAISAPVDEQLPGLIALAIEKDLDVEKLERLIALQERVLERNAEMAMAQALAAFQADCPPIPRIRTADVRKNGVKQYDYKFAPLEEVARVIRPHLTANGLSYTHDAEISGSQVKVVCTLQHVEGAKRKASFEGPIDASGGKNPLQAVASARSYGRRYSLLDVLGLTTGDEDDDGNGGAGRQSIETITREQAADLGALADEVLGAADMTRFLGFLGVSSLEDLPAKDLRRAISALEKKRGGA